MSVRVYDLAHCRAGDKGHSVNISVIAYDRAAYRHLEATLTEARVLAAFRARADGPVTRYPLPKVQAFNFVIANAFGGGVTANLSQDLHGKSLSSLMLAIALPDPDPETR